MRFFAVLAVFTAISSAVGCATPKGETGADKRASILDMQDKTIDRLEKEKPGMRARIEEAPGYGCFSNISTKIFLVGTGNGYGVVTDNSTGEVTYMKMAELGAGIGAGIKDFRAVFVFNDSDTLRTFVDEGWELGGDADAAAVNREDGGGVSAGASVNPIDVYQFTDRGLMLNAMVNATKYWKYAELN